MAKVVATRPLPVTVFQCQIAWSVELTLLFSGTASFDDEVKKLAELFNE